DLFDGNLYINFHTPMNPAGEVRGQITVKQPPQCSCKNATSAKSFKSCVKHAIAALDKSEKKEDLIKALKRDAKKASCGSTKTPKKAIACCLPNDPENNIVVGKLCAAVPAKQCTKLGGTQGGTSCSPNPCTPPASASGAFLDD